ncbi:MAG: class I SAM-dependent methyltransferase [Candidatus Brocadiia bacterium]|jgi:SAM-dependent methyltransferase
MSQQPTHFDRVAEQYDAVFPAHITAHYLRKRARLIGALLRGPFDGAQGRPEEARMGGDPRSNASMLPGRRALDVGCGTGMLMAALKPYGSVVGVDSSEGMIAVLRREGRGEAVVAPVDRLPFEDGSFDVVFCVAVLHHVAEPEKVRRAIHEMVRVARPGGALVIWDHNPRNPYWPRLMRRAPQDTGAERLIPAAEIVRALEESGARQVRVTQSGLVPEFVPRALMPLARLAEAVVERTPLLRRFCAHNVITAIK